MKPGIQAMMRWKLLLAFIQNTLACCDAISISGLTGRSDANGRYEAMGQTLNGRPVYDQIEGRVRQETPSDHNFLLQTMTTY